MTTSGTYNFNPANSDLTLDILSRIGVRGRDITTDHMQDILLSANLILADWSANRSVDLWAVDLQSVPLVQGGKTIIPPANTIMVLDMYIRTYQMGAPLNQTPSFSTTLGSSTVQVTIPSNGVSVGQFINIVIPVSVGGLIVFGFYKVISVLGPNDFTITATGTATSTLSNVGAVPSFTTTASSAQIAVLLPAHGYLAGQSFTVQVPTTVGNVMLQGPYTISSVVSADIFQITSPIVPTINQTVAENNGQAQFTLQNQTAAFQDRILTPMSRDEYAAQPQKEQQGVPSVYWFNRQIQPTITLWQVPDGNGPYELFYYRMRELQDWSPKRNQTADMPTRFMRAFTAEMAYDMVLKYPQKVPAAMIPLLKSNAEMTWSMAAGQDTENASIKLQPNFSPYFNP